jgi:hypothetical protein
MSRSGLGPWGYGQVLWGVAPDAAGGTADRAHLP